MSVEYDCFVMKRLINTMYVFSCPDGIHENCAIHVTCCTDELPVYFEIKRHVPASVFEVELFDSVVIDCEM